MLNAGRERAIDLDGSWLWFKVLYVCDCLGLRAKVYLINAPSVEGHMLAISTCQPSRNSSYDAINCRPSEARWLEGQVRWTNEIVRPLLFRRFEIRDAENLGLSANREA